MVDGFWVDGCGLWWMSEDCVFKSRRGHQFMTDVKRVVPDDETS